MSFRHVYTVPAYYPNFHCKAGDCRHPCCVGWDIAIGMEEYFRMLGMNCSPELRRRLDTAFHPADDPSEHHYAVISPRWDGDCPLHLPNGYCALQCECGENAIPSVCRYYPRSPKSKYAYQCQCANSCEAVVELLFAQEEAMTFIRQRLSFRMVEELTHEHDPVARLFPSVQRACLHILQDRERPLSHRFQHLGELVMVMDVPYRSGNAAGIHAVLPFAEAVKKADAEVDSPPLTDPELQSALTYLRDYLCHIEESNPQLGADARKVREYLHMSEQGGMTSDTVSVWRDSAARFEKLFPDNERMLEQVFVNHLCYDGFPFSGPRQNMWDSYLALMTAYALIRVFSVGAWDTYTAEHPALLPTEAYADIVAAVFRFVEHTSFNHNTAILSRRFSFERPERIMLLCRL